MHWTKVVAFLEGKCQEYVSDSGKKSQNAYARGFVLQSGLQLAVETKSPESHTNVWIEDCGPPPVGSMPFSVELDITNIYELARQASASQAAADWLADA